MPKFVSVPMIADEDEEDDGLDAEQDRIELADEAADMVKQARLALGRAGVAEPDLHVGITVKLMGELSIANGLAALADARMYSVGAQQELFREIAAVLVEQVNQRRPSPPSPARTAQAPFMTTRRPPNEASMPPDDPTTPRGAG